MSVVLQEIRQKHGCIQGIVHAAGVGGEGFIRSKDRVQVEKILRPKVQGTLILDALTQQDELEFFVIFSSATSLFGGAGESDYTAANSFLDSFGAYRNKNGKNTMVVNWTAWREIGMHVDFNAKLDSKFKSLSTQNALQLYDRCLQQGVKQVVIGEIQYEDETLNEYIDSDNGIVLKISQSIADRIRDVHMKKQSTVVTQVTLTGREAGYTDNEKQVAAIWSKHLGYRELCVKDNFFELGGDSLIALKVIRDVNKIREIDLNLSNFFLYPTIAELAAFIDHEASSSAYAAWYIPYEMSKDHTYPVTHMQKRMYILYRFDEQSLDYNITPKLHIQGELNYERLRYSIEQLTERHESLRTSYTISNQVVVQKINPVRPIAVSRREILPQQLQEEIKKVQHSFTLEEDPLFCVWLFKCGEGDHILVLDIHHINFDGASVSILFKDFKAIYEGKDLPPLKAQYKDFAIAHNRYMESEVIGAQLDYWKARLNGAKNNLSILYDASADGQGGGTYELVLSEEENRNIVDALATLQCSAFIFLLSATYVAIWKKSRLEDIVIATTVDGRQYPETEHLIGVFVNSILLRNYPCTEKLFHTFLNEVQNNTYQDMKHRDIYIGDVVQLLETAQYVPDTPYTVSLTMLHEDIHDMTVGDLVVTPMKTSKDQGDCDLHIIGHEQDGQLQLQLHYRKSRFLDRSIEGYGLLLKNIMLNAVQNPDSPLIDIAREPTATEEFVIDFSF